MSFTEEENQLLDLGKIIQYLENTKAEEWCVDVVRTKGNTQNCLLGHLHNYGGGDEGKGGFVCGMFEEFYATTYMFYRINDGEHPKYQQETAKDRIIAYLKDLKSGDELSTGQLFEQEMREYDESNKSTCFPYI